MYSMQAMVACVRLQLEWEGGCIQIVTRRGCWIKLEFEFPIQSIVQPLWSNVFLGVVGVDDRGYPLIWLRVFPEPIAEVGIWVVFWRVISVLTTGHQDLLSVLTTIIRIYLYPNLDEIFRPSTDSVVVFATLVWTLSDTFIPKLNQRITAVTWKSLEIVCIISHFSH